MMANGSCCCRELGAALLAEERLEAADVGGEAGVAVAEALEGFEGSDHVRGCGMRGCGMRTRRSSPCMITTVRIDVAARAPPSCLPATSPR